MVIRSTVMGLNVSTYKGIKTARLRGRTTYLSNIFYLKTLMSSRKDTLEKEKNAIMSKDVVTKNPIFEASQVGELYNMFSLYADPRNRKSDIRDVLITARTLGLDTKYQLVFRALEEIAEARKGDPVDFETFLRDLTAKLVIPSVLHRDHLTLKRDATPLSTYWTSTARASLIWTPWFISTTS
jgi:hypothetical protein